MAFGPKDDPFGTSEGRIQNVCVAVGLRAAATQENVMSTATSARSAARGPLGSRG